MRIHIGVYLRRASKDLLCAGALDRAIAYAFLGNITSLVLGGLTAVLIAWRLSPEVQGYYYAFGGLISAQFLIELGLGHTVMQFASHEWSELRFDRLGRIVGDPDSISRLSSLGRIGFSWYGTCAALVVFGLGPWGYLFFSGIGSNDIEWMGPWYTLCVIVGLNLILAPLFFLLQGCNQVRAFWFYRFVQQGINGASLSIAILFGAGLWALPAAAATGLIWSGVFLWKQPRELLRTFVVPSVGPSIDWRTEVWPIQWRVGISWVSAYLTTSAFAPILFHLGGPVVAGQAGMTAALAMVILAISSNWVVTKAPQFGILAAQRRFVELDDLFRKSLSASLIVCACGCIGTWSLVYMLYTLQFSLGLRLLPPFATALLLVATALNAGMISLSVYLRAHKKEPLAVIHLLTGLSSVVLGIVTGRELGALGVIGGYLGMVALFQVPISIAIFRRCQDVREKESPRQGSGLGTHVLGAAYSGRVEPS